MTDPTTQPRPRARFAPSPTGFFHVGSARAALFNWLFVRQQGGTFILRIEDTDAARNRPEWTDGIITALDWLGMSPDEGPYFQSAQADVHAAAIEALWDSGALYACTCTREQIDERTKQRAAAGDPTPGYDGYCRDLGLPRGEGRALRFRTPDEGVVEVHDLVRGDVEFPQRALEDFICVKGNGQPLFVLANAVDDRTMAISHVIRGEDQLPTTPRQIMLWGALEPRRGCGSGLAGVRAPPTAGERAGEEALQAPRPRGGGDVPGAGLPAGGLPQLSGALGLEPRRRGDRAPRGDPGALPARGRAAVAGLLRRQEALPHERCVHPRVVRR